SGDPHVLLYAVAFVSFLPPSAHLALPHALERVILRAMAREPSQRFASMAELARALLPFASASTRAYWEAVLEAANPSGARGPSAARGVRNPNQQLTRALSPEATSRSALAVLDVPGLFALLRKRPSVILGGVAAL